MSLTATRKTQAALEYVHQHADTRSVFWVRGNNFLKFSEDFRSILPYAKIPHRVAASEEKELLKTVRHWFESPASGDWVLVIDDAENEADYNSESGPISELLPQGPKGTVIFTTRSRRVAEQQGCETIEIGKMRDEDARALLLARLENPKNLSEADQKALTLILCSLDHLPLALVGAASLMREESMSPSEYWDKFKEIGEQRKPLPPKFHCIRKEVGMTESIMNAYFLTFDQLERRMSFAADILRLSAFLDHKQIPEKLLERSNRDREQSGGSLDGAIGKLVRLSLVISRKDGTGRPVYELHRLVQHSIREYLSEEEASEWKEKALEVIWRLFPHCKHEFLQECADYLPHALAVTENSTSPMAEEVCFRMALYLKEAAHHDTAEAQIRRYQEAEKLYRSALAGRENVLKHGHRDILESVAFLGEVLEFQEKHEEAEVMCRRALEGRERVLGPYHPDTLEAVFHLASALQGQGKHDEAEVLLSSRRIVKFYEEMLGPDHPGTLVSHSILAGVLRDQKRYNEAEEMLRDALKIMEMALGPEDPDTLEAIDSLAFVLQQEGRYNEAENLHLRALEGREKVLGEGAIDTLTSLWRLAGLYEKCGQAADADSAYRRVYTGLCGALGEQHSTSRKCLDEYKAFQ
ncbi:unnamed protein product, partial [Tuber aestivum]